MQPTKPGLSQTGGNSRFVGGSTHTIVPSYNVLHTLVAKIMLISLPTQQNMGLKNDECKAQVPGKYQMVLRCDISSTRL